MNKHHLDTDSINKNNHCNSYLDTEFLSIINVKTQKLQLPSIFFCFPTTIRIKKEIK